MGAPEASVRVTGLEGLGGSESISDAPDGLSGDGDEGEAAASSSRIGAPDGSVRVTATGRWLLPPPGAESCGSCDCAVAAAVAMAAAAEEEEERAAAAAAGSVGSSTTAPDGSISVTGRRGGGAGSSRPAR